MVVDPVGTNAEKVLKLSTPHDWFRSAVNFHPRSSKIPNPTVSITHHGFSKMKSTLQIAGLAALLTPSFASPIIPRATKVQYAGVNIAGFDFGCGIDGTCSLTGTNKPYDIVSGANAVGQMQHFVKDDTLNAFRLPVGWQFLTNGRLGAQLDSNNAAQYDRLVQGCLNSGAALCILDIHNYARWNGGIVGQGGPTNAQLVNVWKQLAVKYGKNSKIAFGVMNEPHDVPVSFIFVSVILGFGTQCLGIPSTTKLDSD
jgi:aryl-phospho-beta-D-glucosidase BglC (GH1 family)